MGAWNAGLYSDDTACDVRDSFIAHLKQGKSGEESIQAVLDDYDDSLADHEVECLVVLPLADTAWRYGRLTEQLRDRALALISCGADLHVWKRDAPQHARERQAALNKLQARLLRAQPVPRNVRLLPRKPKRIVSTHAIGSVFLLDLPGGRKAAMVLAGQLDVGDSVQPIFSVLTWCGRAVPSLEELAKVGRTSLVFPSGLGLKRRVGILWLDKRTHPLAPLEEIEMVLPGWPGDDQDAVFLTIDRIAREVDAQLIALPTGSFRTLPSDGPG